MITFGMLFISAIAIVFGGRGLVNLARVFLVGCVVAVVGFGAILVHYANTSHAFVCEQYASDVKYGLLKPSDVPQDCP